MNKHNLKDILVVVTGVGYKESKRIFSRSEPSDMIEIEERKFKLNIGAATARYFADVGADVCMVSGTEEKLFNIKEHICEHTQCNSRKIAYHVADLTNSDDVERVFKSLSKSKPIWLVHCVGMGSQNYVVKNDNPYLSFDEIPENLVVKEFEVTVTSLLIILKNMRPLFKTQAETRIAVVTSMSAIRPFAYGFSHTAAKAGAHNAVRSICLELSLNYKSVYITEILPGMVDTGLYDTDEVIESIEKISETFGFFGDKAYKNHDLAVMPPSSVAESIGMAFSSKAHILSVNLVGQGQITNMGA
jgi:short-subunit dehydrogenase